MRQPGRLDRRVKGRDGGREVGDGGVGQRSIRVTEAHTVATRFCRRAGEEAVAVTR